MDKKKQKSDLEEEHPYLLPMWGFCILAAIILTILILIQ
jgi:hypothetical protein